MPILCRYNCRAVLWKSDVLKILYNLYKLSCLISNNELNLVYVIWPLNVLLQWLLLLDLFFQWLDHIVLCLDSALFINYFPHLKHLFFSGLFFTIKIFLSCASSIFKSIKRSVSSVTSLTTWSLSCKHL